MHRVRAVALFTLLAALGCSTPKSGVDELRVCTGMSPPAAPDGAAAAPAAPKLKPEDRNFDDEDIALDLELDMGAGTVTGTATHTMTALADLSSVRMHLKDMTVTSVTTGDGATCTATHAGGVLTIGLDRPRTKGERFSLTISYGGRPKSGLWFFKPTADHPEVPLQAYTQGEGIENRHWIPCWDLPDERTTTSIRVVVPAGLQTLSNGVPTGTEKLDGNRVAHSWRQDRPHVSYLISLVVGTFDVVKRDAAGVEQYDYVAPGWAPWCDEIFGRTPSMMAFFQEYTAQPYPYPRYSQVTVWDFMWGGMENTGATTLNMRSLHKEGVRPDYTADGLVAHELAHQWFGDLITCRTMNHIWLNEGFATYFTDLWTEQHEGPDAFAVACLGQRESYMNGVDLKATSEKERPKVATDCGDMERHQYVKGASVLHMLRKLLGDDAFQRGIRRYVRDCADKSVESEALRAALEAESKLDLKWFFDQWVYGNGFPELTVATVPRGPQGMSVIVEQTQPVTKTMPTFRLPFDAEVRWPSSKKVVRKRFEMTERRQEFGFTDLPAADDDGRPLDNPIVLFDPDHWLLARVSEVRSRSEWEWELRRGPHVVGRLLAARALANYGMGAGDSLSICVGSEAGEAAAIAAAMDPRFEVRAEACTSLGKLAFDEDAEHLLIAAEDKDSRVRRAAVTALGEHKAALVAASLKKHLAEDPSAYVAADAAAALGKTKAEGAFEALVAGLARESHRDQIRQRIMDGLKELGDKRGADVAMRYLDYSWGKGIQHQLRKSALEAVVALAPEASETKAWVLKLLRDPYFRMKQWAADHAVKLKLKEALPILDDQAVNAIGPGVTRAMKSAAERLRKAAEPADDEE